MLINFSPILIINSKRRRSQSNRRRRREDRFVAKWARSRYNVGQMRVINHHRNYQLQELRPRPQSGKYLESKKLPRFTELEIASRKFQKENSPKRPQSLSRWSSGFSENTSRIVFSIIGRRYRNTSPAQGSASLSKHSQQISVFSRN